MEEVWKPVVGYEGEYEVSNLGRIKSFKKGRWGLRNGSRHFREKILSLSKNTGGYLDVTLYREGKNMYRVHRLVAKAFIPNHDNKEQVNHINGIKTDNNVNNLEWNTASENIRHAFRIGLKDINLFQESNPNKGKFGKDNTNSKIVHQY